MRYFTYFTLNIIYKIREQDKSPPDKKPPNNEIIIQSYYICFILMVILKDISKN